MTSQTFFLTTVNLDLELLLSSLLSLAGIAALSALTYFLLQLAKTAKEAKKLVEGLRPELEKVVTALPPTLAHLETVSGNLVDITDAVAEALPPALESASEMVEDVGTTVSSLTTLLNQVLGLVQGLLGAVRKPLSTAKLVTSGLRTYRKAKSKLSRKRRRA